MSQLEFVSVTLVTYNSGRFIKKCLESVLAQKYADLELIVIDNASTDGTVDILEQFDGRCRIFYNEENVGFAAAQNQAIAMSRGDWVLTLNPDVLLLPGFVKQLVEAGQLHPRIGAVCGKLLTIKSTFELPDKAVIDSTGMYFTPMLRHLDRGSQLPDGGEYSNFEYVFGATAAAALYRREMIEDVAVKGRVSRPRLFCLPGRRGCGMAASTAGLALFVYALRPRLSRPECSAGESAGAAGGDQHALGEEPVPDANQKHDLGLIPAELVFDNRTGPGGDRGLYCAGA